MEEPTVLIPNVKVVSQSDLGWFCEHDGRRMFIGTGQIPPGARLPAVGTCGTVEVHAFALRDLWPSGPRERRDTTQPDQLAADTAYCDGSYRR